MQISKRIAVLIGSGLLSLFCATAQADGLTDLKAALTRLQGLTPIKGVLDVKTSRRQGEGKEMDESAGQVAVAIEDGGRGLQVLYSRETLARAEQEARAKGRDRNSKTPTVLALSELGSAEVRPMMSAVAALTRQIEEGVFKGNRPAAMAASRRAC